METTFIAGFIIGALALAFIFLVYQLGVWRQRKKTSKTQEAAHLTEAELEALIRAAVEDATKPLQQKINRLEEKRHDEQPVQLPERLEEHDFGLIADEDDETFAPAGERHRRDERA